MYLVNHKDKQYAIKKLSKDFLMRTQKVNSVFRERDILTAGIDCKYIPNLYHTFSDEEYLYIVLEYISGGTLSDKLKLVNGFGFGKEQAQFYAAQIVVGLEYLQAQNIAHRDLKPDNIMIQNDQYLKIIDFGEAKIVDAYEDLKSPDTTLESQEQSFFNRLIPQR